MLTDLLGMPLTEWATQQIRDNQMLVAIIGGMMLGSALFLMRSIPAKLWRLFLLQYTVVVEIHNDSGSYEEMLAFLVSNGFVHEKVRRLTIDKRVSHEVHNMHNGDNTRFQPPTDGHMEDQLTLGQGWFIFWYRGRPIMLNHVIGEAKMRERPRTLTLRTFGRSRKIMSALVAQASQLRASAMRDKLEIWTFNGRSWEVATRKRRRPLETVVLDDAQKTRIQSDLEWFMANPEWYQSRGIPYRRGYLLHGPPGTGKTSLIFALASHYAVPVYMLNLSTMLGDDALMTAMGDIPSGVFLLIEDIDATDANIGPRTQPDRTPPRPTPLPDETTSDERPSTEQPDDHTHASPMGVSLSGLMNALDGIASPDRLVTFMTTNHPERIEPALLRPGRVDRKEEIGYPGRDEAYAMFLRFFPEDDGTIASTFAHAYCRQTEITTAADLQELCMEHANDPLGAITRIESMRGAHNPARGHCGAM